VKITFEGTMAEFQALFVRGNGVSQSVTVAPSDLPAQFRPIPEVKKEPVGEFGNGVIPPMPENDPFVGKELNLPLISEEKRKASESYWADFCATWADGFEDDKAEQPDRLRMVQDFGSSPYFVAVLIMAYELKSLQRLVEKGLVDAGKMAIPRPFVRGPGNDSAREEHLDYIDRIAANMVQVSHMGAPDLAGTYDYSTKWRRSS
jgi:hypothetical protein